MDIRAISDTHNVHDKIIIPECDILIHAGDATINGSHWEIDIFMHWFSAQPAKYKIFVAGNHDTSLILESKRDTAQRFRDHNIFYLENDTLIIDDIVIYGAPFQTIKPYWPFYTEHPFWDCPQKPDIFISHMPPYGMCDRVNKLFRGETEYNIGDKQLLEFVNLIAPRVHVFGHIHEGFGEHLYQNNITMACNVACLDENYILKRGPTRIGANIWT